VDLSGNDLCLGMGAVAGGGSGDGGIGEQAAWVRSGGEILRLARHWFVMGRFFLYRQEF